MEAHSENSLLPLHNDNPSLLSMDHNPEMEKGRLRRIHSSTPVSSRPNQWHLKENEIMHQRQTSTPDPSTLRTILWDSFFLGFLLV